MSGLNLALIPRFGLPGASLAVTITSFFLMIAILVALVREFKISLLPKAFFVSSGSSIIIGFIAYTLPHSVYTFIPLSAALFGLHLVFLWQMKILTPKDLGPLSKLLAKK